MLYVSCSRSSLISMLVEPACVHSPMSKDGTPRFDHVMSLHSSFINQRRIQPLTRSHPFRPERFASNPPCIIARPRCHMINPFSFMTSSSPWRTARVAQARSFTNLVARGCQWEGTFTAPRDSQSIVSCVSSISFHFKPRALHSTTPSVVMAPSPFRTPQLLPLLVFYPPTVAHLTAIW